VVGEALHPGGVLEIPGIDPGWGTRLKRTSQTLGLTGLTAVSVKSSYLRVHRLHDGKNYEQYTGTPPTPVDSSLIEIIKEHNDVDMSHAVAPGETVYFDAQLAVAGDSTANLAVVVLTPSNPNGGFTVFGRSRNGTFVGSSYGADDFNQPVGILRAGAEGTPEGWNTIRVRGVLANGEEPGLLRLAIGQAEEEGLGPVLLVDQEGAFPTASVRIWRWDDTIWTQIGDTSSAYVPRTIKVLNGTIYVVAATAPPTDTMRVIRSTDTGSTWTIGAVPPITLVDDLYQIRDMVVASDGKVWITVQGGIDDLLYVYTSTDDGDTWTLNETFSDVGSPILAGGQAKIAAHPSDPDRIAILYHQDSTSNYLLKVTTDSSNWNSYSIGALGLNFNASSPALEWLPNSRLVIYHEFYDGVALTAVARIGISTDDGANFTYIEVYDDVRMLGDYNTVGFAKTLDNVLFAFAWIDNISGAINPEFFRSLDGGDTWDQFQGVLTEENSVIHTVDEPAGMVYDEQTGSLITHFGSADEVTIVIPNATTQWTDFDVYEQPDLNTNINNFENSSTKVVAQ